MHHQEQLINTKERLLELVLTRLLLLQRQLGIQAIEQEEADDIEHARFVDFGFPSEI